MEPHLHRAAFFIARKGKYGEKEMESIKKELVKLYDKVSIQSGQEELALTILNKLEKRCIPAIQISGSCISCGYLGGDCCGTIYWEASGMLLCNECGREFDLILTAPAATEQKARVMW